MSVASRKRGALSADLLAVILRRAVKLVWWTLTLQLPSKYRQRKEWRAAQSQIRPPQNDHALAVPFSWAAAASPPAPSLAVICHMFFDEMAGEFREYLSNIPFPADLILTTDTEAKKANIERAFATWSPGSVEVRVCLNRGRDIAPKLIACADVYDRYEYVLHLHTKRSPHGPQLAGWRNYLLDTLVGSPATVASVFAVFKAMPDVGIIAPQHFEGIRPVLGWGFNYTQARALSRRLGLDLDMNATMDFPSGSMFWARSAALAPILRLGLSCDEFPIERHQTDGTLAHAIERMYFHVCEAAGYHWLKIAQPGLLRETRHRAVDVGAPDELPGVVLDHRVRLLKDAVHRASRLPRAA